MSKEFNPLETPQGVNAFLANLSFIKSAAYDKSDFDAMNMLVDFETAFAKVKMTKRQKQAVELVHFKNLTQKEAGAIMGISQQAVGQLIQAVATKISEQYTNDLIVKEGGNDNDERTS